MIKRWIDSKLEKRLSEVPAVALLGARQVGKTTLAKSIARTTKAIYLDLESSMDQFKLQDPEHFFKTHQDQLIILDEIQRHPNLFNILRGVIDRRRQDGHRHRQFLFLGSASMHLLKQSSESLAGRISYMEMSGLNTLEINMDAQSIQKRWLRGGFPESYLANDTSVAMNWMEDLIRTYVERDVPQLGFKIPSSRLRRLWTMMAHLQGEPINASKLASNLEVGRAQIQHYIDILTGLLLIRRLEPWHANVKKRLVKSPRYYIRDSGTQHRLLGIDTMDALLSNPVLGKSWEGFVIENIHSVLDRRSESYFYRTAAGAEIDLIINLPSSERWAIEIKYGHAPKLGKHFSQTCDDVGATQKYVVYGGDDEFSVKDVTVISLHGFMQKLIEQQEKT